VHRLHSGEYATSLTVDLSHGEKLHRSPPVYVNCH
jgi:hypothetical protein